ncbi:MAG: four-helix bundle copper-binding protein [Candidatus Latescibacterota bacterium]
MNQIKSILQSHPSEGWTDVDMLSRCIEACYDCAQACTSCADACLSENGVKELVKCIRLDLDCADICETTGRMMSRLSAVDLSLLQSQLETCIAACKVCGDECDKHAGRYDHCRVCAESCVSCANECTNILQSVRAAV